MKVTDQDIGRRIQRRMVWLGLAAAVGLSFPPDPLALGILTLAVAASIFHFRGLRAQVATLDPVGTPSAARVLLVFLRRNLLLAAGLLLILFVNPSRPLALVLGVSTLPAALMIEALVQAFGAPRRPQTRS